MKSFTFPRSVRLLPLFIATSFLNLPALAQLDTNANGLSDLFERQYNEGNLFDPANPDHAPEADADGDGWTTIEEAVAGTNPFNGKPPEGIVSALISHLSDQPEPPSPEFPDGRTVDVAILSWDTLPGKQYILTASPDLSAGSWLPVGDPIQGDGNPAANAITLTDATGETPQRLFWRVQVEDLDSDSDTLTDHEEIMLGTNPFSATTFAAISDAWVAEHFHESIASFDPDADEEADGLTNAQEYAQETDPNNSDTDGDGIVDGVDPEPSIPRGPAPSIATENTSGNPISYLIKDEIVKLVFTVANPGGDVPTTSNLTLFVNDQEDTATFTPLGDSGDSSQRFLLTWTAKTTADYPDSTVQNLTLRFRDADQATSWLDLARIDVAEWEGKVIAMPFVTNEVSWGFEVINHLNGAQAQPIFVSRNNASDNVYRGPKMMTLVDENDLTYEIQLNDHDITFLIVEIDEDGAPTVRQQLDYADVATGMDVEFSFLNGSTKSLRFDLSQEGINATLAPGDFEIHKASLVDVVFPYSTPGTIQYLDGTEWQTFYSSTLPVLGSAPAHIRLIKSINVFNTDTGQLKRHGLNNYLARDAKITPYAPGTLDYPGLPQASVTSPYTKKHMLISSGKWRKINIRIFPPQEHFTYSRGYSLNLGTGTSGTDAPQQGWTAQTEDDGTFTPLTIPPDGKIEILPTDTELHAQITSPEGLTLFLKRDETVNQAHELRLEILPKVTENDPAHLGTLSLYPVDLAVDYNRDGEITFDGVDRATVDQPYHFWTNSDKDTGDDAKAKDNDPNDKTIPLDSKNDRIDSLRDLEDFAMLALDVGSLSSLVTSGAIEVGFRFVNVKSGTNPRIRIFYADGQGYGDTEFEGGKFLTDTIKAQEQMDTANSFARYDTGTQDLDIIPKPFFNGSFAPEVNSENSVIHFIFEGVSAGEGTLALVANDASGNKLEVPLVPMKISKVTDMYEHWTVGDTVNMAVSAIQDTPWRTGDSGIYDESGPEDDDCIVFVHGWRMKEWERRYFASTSFKRLWHQGYKGKFFHFSWPTEWTPRRDGGWFDYILDRLDNPPEDSDNYADSEEKAYHSAKGLLWLLNKLKSEYGANKVRLFSHSMGGVVGSEALHQHTQTSSGILLNTYAPCQAAMAAHAYDRNAPERPPHTVIDPTGWNTPEVYASYKFNGSAQYFDRLSKAGKIVNFHNRKDDALRGWNIGQSFKPNWIIPLEYYNYGVADLGAPEAFYHYPLNKLHPRYLNLNDDVYEIYAHAAEARSFALGVNEVTIFRNFNLNSGFSNPASNFGDTKEDHSAQFRATNMIRHQFWHTLLIEFGIIPN